MPAKRIYLAGPMTGLPEYNYPAFNAEAARLRALGFHVENPAENPEQSSWEDYLRQAIRQMLTCDMVALLPGWEGSRGAGFERSVALQVGMALVMADQITEALPSSAEPIKLCDHQWTDDGMHLLVCTVCGEQEDHDPHWRDMATAPRDGTLVRLLVEFTEHATEDADQAPTIGANNFENDGEDRWQFAGWCWSHDHFTQGQGEPIGWLPMLDEPRRIAHQQQEQQP